MSIVYAVVSSAKGTVSAFNGAARLDVSDLAGKLIQQVDFNVDTKKSYSSKGFTFNYIVEGQVCYLCVADDTFPRRLCFGLLERLRSENAQKGKVSKSFLESELSFFSNNPEADKIRSVQKQVDEVKDIMMENIDKILQRGEKIEDIDRKADDLMVQSQAFQKQSKKLKCEMFKKNVKLTICLVASAIILIVVLILIIYFAVR